MFANSASFKSATVDHNIPQSSHTDYIQTARSVLLFVYLPTPFLYSYLTLFPLILQYCSSARSVIRSCPLVFSLSVQRPCSYHCAQISINVLITDICRGLNAVVYWSFRIHIGCLRVAVGFAKKYISFGVPPKVSVSFAHLRAFNVFVAW